MLGVPDAVEPRRCYAIDIHSTPDNRIAAARTFERHIGKACCRIIADDVLLFTL
jgi:hypothetical protein